MTALYEQALNAVRYAISILDLPRIAPDEVVVRKLPADNAMWNRGITISPDSSRIDDSEPAESTNERDMLGYPCVITIVDGTGRGWSEGITNVTEWQQKIRRTFHNKRLSAMHETGSNHVICKVPHDHLVDKKAYPANLDVSQMIVWVWMLEKRTN